MSSNCLISRNIPLGESAQNFLYEYDSSYNEASAEHKTLCGIFSNSKYVWYANGPRFEVVETRTGRKVSSWTFGSILKDTTTKVNCVAEIISFTKEIPLVILGLECSLTGGIICVFDILTSKVLRAIQVEDKVSYIHVIDSGSNIFQILGPIRAFDGVVAVGLAGGDVLLVDLCQQCIDDVRLSISSEGIKDETDPSQIMSLMIKDVNEIEHHKQVAAESGHHLAIYLNAVLNSKSPHFTLRGPKGDDRVHVNKVEVIVTSIYYCSQLGSLLVGYNFGAWQIWDIINMVLIYTSPVYEENIPVSHFTVQEPADDPRAFCYVWAIYSHTDRENVGFPVAVLYSLSYEAKDFHEGYGYLYQNLQSCAVRFQVELSTLGSSSAKAKGACCLRLTSYNKGLSNRLSMQDSHEDALTICSMVWTVWHADSTDTYISIFDLNQWYRAQMPSVPKENCLTYLSYICVNDVLNGSNDNSRPLDVYIDGSSITQFLGIQKPEEHYYPTSLSYDFCTCTTRNITFVRCNGQQRALLGYFESTGPLLLSKPEETFQQALRLSLTPLFTEVVQSDLTSQREYLLNVALEQHMISFLCKCASTWSNGSYSCVGCSLDFFLNWCWNRVVTLKTNADKLCEPLFDCAGASLDANNQRLLNSCIRQLSNLHSVYKFMCRKLELFEITADMVKQQEHSLDMIVVYLDVLQWLVNIGLLPEFSESARANKMHATGVPYPIDSLLEYYKERRSCLQSLDPSNITRRTPVMYIDHLIEHKLGESLQKFWEDDGGNGFYPPPSLQSLLRTYLIEDVDLLYKHSVVVYVFLDLATALDQSRYKFIITHLIKFPTVFKMGNSATKVIQAFWQLDHGQFGSAIEQFSDPLIDTCDLETWHHKLITNALLLQGCHSFALLYFQIRKPPIENVDDIKKVLSMYVLNRMVDEAINFARRYSSKDNKNELVRHVFKECEKTKQFQKLLDYPLTSKEEEILMIFLKEISYTHLEEFQVTYYLNRSRFLDIFKMEINKEGKNEPSGLGAQKNASFRTMVVANIQSCLPSVTKEIMNVYQTGKVSTRTEVTRPQPMSVFVHNTKQQAVSKSTLIRTGILKAKEIWTHPILEESINEELPFIGTPSLTPSISRKRPSIICSRLITSDINENDASPRKRMRLSPGRSLIDSTTESSITDTNTSDLLRTTKLTTPIVRRKTERQSDSYKSFSEKFNTYTPQSILKVKYSTTTPSKNHENVPQKNKDPDAQVHKNVILISPKGRTSYKDLSLSNQTLNESENEPETSATEQSPASRNDFVEEKDRESLVPSKPHIQSRAPLSPRRISHFSGEETQLQSPQILSPRRTTRSMRGKSEEPPMPSPNAYLEAPLPVSPRRSSRLVRGKSEEPIPSPSNSQSDTSLSSRRISRSTRGKSEEPTPSSSNDHSTSNKDPASSHNIKNQSPAPPSPRRTSFRLSSRKSLSRRVLEHNAFSAGIPQIIESDNSKVPTKAALDADVDAVSTENSAALTIPEPIDISMKDTQLTDNTEVTDTEQIDESYDKDHIDMVEGISPLKQTEEDIVPVRRRSSFKIKSRKSLSRMVLENNTFSATSVQNLNKSDLLEQSKSQLGFSVTGSLGSEDLNRILDQKKCDDLTDFSLSPMRYSTSISTNSSKEVGDADDDGNVADEEQLLPKSSATFEIAKEDSKPEIVRRTSTIRGRKSVGTSAKDPTSIYTSTPFNSNQSSFVEPSSSWAEKKLESLIQNQTFDISDFSLSFNNLDNSSAAISDTFERKGEINLPPVDKEASEVTDVVEEPVEPKNQTETEQLIEAKEKDVEISNLSELPPEDIEANKEFSNVLNEDVGELNQKDVEISNLSHLDAEDIEANKEDSNVLNEEVDEFNQAQIVSTDIIEIVDSSSSKSETTMESTPDSSNISNASTFGDDYPEENVHDEIVASDEVSNEPCETSDEFYDADNAILVLDYEDMDDDVEGDHESMSPETVEDEANGSSGEVVEPMDVDDMDDPQVEKSDSEYQSAQTLKTSDENIDIEVSTEANKPSLVVEEEIILDQKCPGTTEKNNSEDKDLEQDSDVKEEYQAGAHVDIVLYQEVDTEKVNTELERPDDITIEQDTPLGISILQEKETNGNFNDVELEKNIDIDISTEPNEPSYVVEVDIIADQECPGASEKNNSEDKDLEKNINVEVSTEGNEPSFVVEEGIISDQECPGTTEKNNSENKDLEQNIDIEVSRELNEPSFILEENIADQECPGAMENNNSEDKDLENNRDIEVSTEPNEPSFVAEEDIFAVQECPGATEKNNSEDKYLEKKIDEQDPTSIEDGQNKDGEAEPVLEQTHACEIREAVSKEAIENIETMKDKPYDEKEFAEECNEDEKNSSEDSHFFDNMTIDPSNITEGTLTDIFDLNDINKTAYVNITVTDILEQTLPENWNNSTITEQEIQSPVQEVHTEAETDQRNEILETKSNKEKIEKTAGAAKPKKLNEDDKQSSKSIGESSMQLRKRSSSSTSNTSNLNRTPRKRSASVEEISTKSKKLPPSPSTSKTSPSRRSKRTASVSSLPVISEEANIKEQSRKSGVKKQEEEKQIVDDIETYSTSRRLTRGQKNLLQKSKRLSTGKMMDEGTAEMHASETSILDDPDLSTSPSTVTENTPSARVMTRRMSQESTSSKISKSSRTTRKSETGDDDDRSTVSLRRSTRQRSKTPDIEIVSKAAGSAKKHLSKIPEELDDEVKDEPPVKRGKSRKK